MCVILDASIINGNWFINCSEYDGEFINAQRLKIVNDSKNFFETVDFAVDKTKSCFSKGGTPWIKLTKPIPNEFLKKGNKVYLS